MDELIWKSREYPGSYWVNAGVVAWDRGGDPIAVARGEVEQDKTVLFTKGKCFVLRGEEAARRYRMLAEQMLKRAGCSK